MEHDARGSESFAKRGADIKADAETPEVVSVDWDKQSNEQMHQHHRWAQAMTAEQIAISVRVDYASDVTFAFPGRLCSARPLLLPSWAVQRGNCAGANPRRFS